MNINESQQTLPLSNSINLNLGQLNHIKIVQNPTPEIGDYEETFKQNKQLLELSSSNQKYLNQLEQLKIQAYNEQNGIQDRENNLQSSQKDKKIDYQDFKNNLELNQGSFNPSLIQKNLPCTPPIFQSDRETPYSNFLSSQQNHNSNSFIPQIQLIKNQQGEQEDRFMSSSPLQEMQSFYLNHNNQNDIAFSSQQQQQLTFEERYNNFQEFKNQQTQQQNQLENLPQQQNNFVSNLAQSNQTQNFDTNNDNKQDILFNTAKNQKLQQQNLQQQAIFNNQQNNQQYYQENDYGNILQSLEREEIFQQKIESLKNQKQKNMQNEQQNNLAYKDQEIYDTGIGAKEFDEIEMLVQRENFENQMIELNDETENLYNEAIQFVNVSKQKDQEMDKELIRQKKDLEEFRRKINEMKSTELTNGNSDGNENILLKKIDLQKLLFKIEDLKYQIHSQSRSQSPVKKLAGNTKYSQTRSYFQNTDEKIKKKVQMNTSQSQVLLNFMNGKSYLSPKNYLEVTERIIGKKSVENSQNLTPPRYGLKASKIGSASNSKSYHNNNNSIQSQQSNSFNKNFPIKSDKKDYSLDRTSNRIISNFNNQLRQSQLNDTIQNNTQFKFENTPKKNSGQQILQQTFQYTEPQNNQSFNELQSNQLSNNKNNTNNFLKNSPMNRNSINLQFIQSPMSTQSLSTQQGRNSQANGCNRFENLENNIFLVQSKTLNSPIISLIGKDRLIVARPFKGTLQKTGSNRVITDGETYTFEKMYMVVSQITKNLKSEILVRNALDNHFKNIFIIGTKSSQKKQIQLEVLQLLQETFRTKILTIIQNNYSCRVKLRYNENVFESQTSVSKLPTSSPSFPQSQSQNQDKSYPIVDDIAIEFNSLDTNINDKIIILNEAVQRIAQLIIDNNKTKIPQNKQLQQSQALQNLLRSKVRTIKLSLIVFSHSGIECKQSYRVSTTNHIIDPDRRTPFQIFKESFHVYSSQQYSNQQPPTFRSFVANSNAQSQQFLQQNNNNLSNTLGFKENKILNDENLVIFSCAPILKYFEQARALFKSANVFEKQCRKLNKQQKQ
ncbi:hypothetical protein TTHERM_00564300 (macronuclear) [Tetrahymena thermophila SB210]|uniref:Uncharacterized protein n=1 Tax=Tetrahymena thermophila (strain SB210) TaxID=312017 RepID=I7MLD1_TETTS|nr:hypothetical protein TTHERM_00564300 [Tetrahymena thermophila SB210]EAS01784.1 hypothetical protein TTHERM_00564300 [Tetrahymena thermophila SB210]|eukprot:XP_001022029.1 hypothetical protein TTHERM_00564300 [Tetrahymena thermophila SB210]